MHKTYLQTRDWFSMCSAKRDQEAATDTGESVTSTRPGLHLFRNSFHPGKQKGRGACFLGECECFCRSFSKRDINGPATLEQNDLFRDPSYNQKQSLKFPTWASSENGTIQELPSTKDSSSGINSFFAKQKQKHTLFPCEVTDMSWFLELQVAFMEYMVLLRICKDQKGSI